VIKTFDVTLNILTNVSNSHTLMSSIFYRAKRNKRGTCTVFCLVFCRPRVWISFRIQIISTDSFRGPLQSVNIL